MSINFLSGVNSYQKQLRNLVKDKYVFAAQLMQIQLKKKAKKQQQKYQNYIKDNLMKAIDVNGYQQIHRLSSIQNKYNLVKFKAFYKILAVGNRRISESGEQQKNKTSKFIENVKNGFKTKQQKNDNISIGCKKLQRLFKLKINQTLKIIKSQVILKQIKLSYQQIIIQKNNQILNRDIQIQNLNEKILSIELKQKNQDIKSPSRHQTSCQTSQQHRIDKIQKLQKQINQKNKEIKQLKKIINQREVQYYKKVQQIQDQMNKLHFYNLKLIKQLQFLKSQSDIKHNECQNSLSFEIFEQRQKREQVGKQLDSELSNKYLKQVIALKQNIQSIKTICLQFFSKKQYLTDKKNLIPKQLLIQLFYLLNMTENDKIMLKRNSMLTQIYS